jgi:hypothetical protein
MYFMIEIGVPEKNKVTGTWIYYADGKDGGS